MVFEQSEIDKITELLLKGRVGILPTDTIYGLHCLSSNQASVDRIHDLKKISRTTPLINLISDLNQLSQFNVTINDFEKNYITEFWPGKNTLIFKNNAGEKISFRLPKNDFLNELVAKTGPLISTSANLHGTVQSNTIMQASDYFGGSVDFYVDGGVLNNQASSLYDLSEGGLLKLR